MVVIINENEIRQDFEIPRKVRDTLRKLNGKLRAGILARIWELAANPSLGKKMVEGGKRKSQIGKYRIFYQLGRDGRLDPESLDVYKRKTAYKRRRR